MCWCVWNVCWPAGGHLLTQHRDDLGAKDFDLLKHGFKRQTGMIHQEQLALVVADVVAHGGIPFDDLLRTTDGQRGLGAEILERWAVSVDRGHIKVGTEFFDSVL